MNCAAFWSSHRLPRTREQEALHAAFSSASRTGDPLQLIISGEDHLQPGWVSTNFPTFDLLDASSINALGLGSRFFADALVAEHVWEHFTYAQALQAMIHARCAMRGGGRLRIAVPDAAHADAQWYVSRKVLEGWPTGHFGGAGSKSVRYPGHRAVWTAPKLSRFACDAGFAGVWVQEAWLAGSPRARFGALNYSDAHGFISRSARNDARNRAPTRAGRGPPNPTKYTSLIVDLIAPPWSAATVRPSPERRGAGWMVPGAMKKHAARAHAE